MSLPFEIILCMCQCTTRDIEHSFLIVSNRFDNFLQYSLGKSIGLPIFKAHGVNSDMYGQLGCHNYLTTFIHPVSFFAKERMLIYNPEIDQIDQILD